MKIRRNLILTSLLLISLTFSVGCSSRTSNVNEGMSMDEIERLPEDQKDLELDKALSKIRTFRKDNTKLENGTWTSMSYNGSAVPGYIPNPNEFNQEEAEAAYQVVYDYMIDELKLPKRGNYEYDMAECMDPRINKIYEDEDKGVAKGYENENIFVAEYETKKDDIYSYLFLVRDSKDSPWKIIHDGTSYKSK